MPSNFFVIQSHTATVTLLLENISFSIALMMEAARTSETLVNFYQTTRCYNSEDSNLHTL
jgi:hypothetical protein